MIQSIVERFPSTSDKGNDFVQIFAIFTVSLGAFSVGAHMAWPSPFMLQLISNSSYIGQITIEEASYFSIITPLSMTLFSIFVGGVMNVVGRKYMIGLIAIPQLIGWILIATSKSVISIYIARAICGISDAIAYCIMPVYIGEITTPGVRGIWGNIPMCAIFLGHLSIMATSISYDIVISAYIFLLPPIAQALLTIFIPESPYFLLMKGKVNEAKIVLRQLRWKQDVDVEFFTLTIDVQRQLSESNTFKDLICIPTNRKALLILITLRTCQQFSGLSAFTIYIQYIFELSGVESLSPLLSSIIFYLVLFIASIFASFVFSKFGRKTMLTLSSFGCTVFLLVDSIYFYIIQETDIDVSIMSWIPLMGLIGYITSLSSGLAILPAIMAGELFSVSIKNLAAFVTCSYLGLTMILVPKLLQLLLSNFSMYVPFLFFTFMCLVSTLFCYCCIPETKGKTLEEIQSIFSKK